MNASLGDLGAVVGVTAAAYVSVLVATRAAGRRTLAQLSAFDTLITIALGTLVGTTAVSPSVSYPEGMAAMLTLIALQVGTGALRQRWPWLRRLVDFRPVPVVEHGRRSLPEGLLGPQLTGDELESQLRLRGTRPELVERAVLEPVGGVSVVGRRQPDGDAAAARHRPPREVLESHLSLRQAGDLEGDLERNYAPDVLLLSAEGVHRGHEGVRTLAGILRSYVADSSYRYQDVVVDGEIGMLRWSAADGDTRVHDGADSYVVRDGRIVAQTIHYSTARDR